MLPEGEKSPRKRNLAIRSVHEVHREKCSKDAIKKPREKGAKPQGTPPKKKDVFSIEHGRGKRGNAEGEQN